MKKISIHPHKGYLNTTFSIFTEGCNDKEIFIKRVGSLPEDTSIFETLPTYFKIKDNSTNIKYTPSLPGYYHIGILGSEQKIASFVVEDAIRFGGSQYKNSFISNNTPWCIIVMKDRTYFYNRDTKEQYVESISPDRIDLINSEVILLTNNHKEGKTLYSLTLKKPLLHFENEVLLTNNTLILADEGENGRYIITIYKYQEQQFEDCCFLCCNSYSISAETKTIYFSDNGIIYLLPLDSLEDFKIEIDYDKYEFISFTNGHYAILKKNYTDKITLSVFDLEQRKIISTFSTSSICTDVEDYSFDNDIINSKIEELISLHSQLGLARYTKLEYKTLNIKNIYVQDDFVYYHIEEERFYINEQGRHKRELDCRLINASQTFDVKINRWTNIDATTDALYICDNGIIKIVRDETIFRETTGKMYITDSDVRIFYKEDEKSASIYMCELLGEHLSISEILKTTEKDIDWTWVSKYKTITSNNKKSICYLPNIQDSCMNSKKIVELKEINCICVDGYIYAAEGKYWGNEERVLPENAIALSENCEMALSLEGTHVYIHNLLKNNTEKILQDIFDSSKYEKVFLSDNGESIIYQKDKELILLDSKTMKETKFPNLNFIRHYNGYRPLFAIDNYRRPRIINPFTRQFVDNIHLSKYEFISPDGELYADTTLDEYVKYYHLLEDRYISKDEYEILRKKYEYSWNCDKESIENNRKVFIETKKVFLKKDNKYTDSWLSCKIKDNNFLSLFVEKRGFAIIKRCSNNNIVAEIPLGPELWFMNYVAFSFDSRYVAIGGRFPDNTTYKGNPVSGLLLIYDLLDRKIVINETSTHAIWSTAFSIDGMWAAYSSIPITYLGVSGEETIKEKICYKNFLTFSPDGRYMALTEQGYKRYEHGNDDWGHQPSTNIHICLSGNPNKDIVPVINDLADGGLESICKSKSVASCSFSLDNKKLMMVGNDGVVVIRNLHLDKPDV